MSIKGIDTQIMISRLPDTSRDTSALQKRPEVAQDTLAVKAKVNDAEDQTRVAKTAESEMEKIRSDVDGGSGAGYGSEGGPGHEKNGLIDESDPDLLIPPENHIIDITI